MVYDQKVKNQKAKHYSNIMFHLANLVAIFHGLVMIGLFAGPIVLFSQKRNRVLEYILLTLAGLTALSFIITGACFLTTLEKNLQSSAGLSSYSTGFVKHYLGEIGINIPDIATTMVISLLVAIVIARFIWLKIKKVK